ncbi:hypothetical protein [Mesorhizobium onobrychidis]|uniref:Uncharacterized protein n=1 Tax=Mesorhizobium onobrychidis TaxID=2775404 RepID=A0ABY5R727_9HYPH|nr:hypothetical protein [Mesorhizobium onobrychidis]UVC19275.1 hypothetical protein IHQ72_29700 [Mesorhizobium onobrychidis]
MTASRDNGGPAFPSTEDHPSYDLPMHCFGMSLRDWFAGQALAGDLAATPNCRPSIIGSAERAYAYADAMLAERAKP